VDLDLLALVACPRCKGSLAPACAVLTCLVCGVAYPLRDAVPILLLEEARPAGEESRRRW
jgi:uncharacterized protein YbaR (Trm112 family)